MSPTTSRSVGLLVLAALLAGAFWAGTRYSQLEAIAVRAPQIAGMLWLLLRIEN